jgi:Predicted N-acetylglucosaminyl transferase
MKIIVAVLITLASLVTASGQNELDKLRAEGYEALYNLDYEGAHKHFQKMVDLAPDNPAGPESYASSIWLQQLNEAWELKATLYSTDAYSSDNAKVDRREADEFRKWIRRAKVLSEARLRKDPRDVEALYFLGAAEGLEAAFAGAVERKYMAALRAASSSVDHHREVLKLSPQFHDAELTIGLQNYIVGSLPLPAKMLAGTMGVRGSKKRGLETLERVATEGHWARDIARILLIDLYKREKRWSDAIKVARELSEKYPRNYLFKLQTADALASQILTLRKAKAPSSAEEKELTNIFTLLSRDKTFDRSTIDLIQHRWTIARQQLAQR